MAPQILAARAPPPLDPLQPHLWASLTCTHAAPRAPLWLLLSQPPHLSSPNLTWISRPRGYGCPHLQGIFGLCCPMFLWQWAFLTGPGVSVHRPRAHPPRASLVEEGTVRLRVPVAILAGPHTGICWPPCPVDSTLTPPQTCLSSLSGQQSAPPAQGLVSRWVSHGTVAWCGASGPGPRAPQGGEWA